MSLDSCCRLPSPTLCPNRVQSSVRESWARSRSRQVSELGSRLCGLEHAAAVCHFRGQLNGRRTRRLRSPQATSTNLRPNDFLHTLQANGFSRVCERMCLAKCSCFVKT
jgi:hypothetical protein